MIKVNPITPKLLLLNAFQSVPEFKVIKESTTELYNHYDWNKSTNNIKRIANTIKESLLVVKKIDVPATLQTAWWISHTATILGTALYISHFTHEDVRIGYWLASVSAVTTYSLILYRNLTASSGYTYFTLASENTHLLLLAVLAAKASGNVLRLIPFSIYSFMNLISHSQFASIVPTMGNLLLLVAAYFELTVFLLNIMGACFNKSTYTVLFHIVFLWIRLQASGYLHSCFQNVIWVYYKTLNELKRIPLAAKVQEGAHPDTEEVIQEEVLVDEGNFYVSSDNDDDDFKYIYEVY